MTRTLGRYRDDGYPGISGLEPDPEGDWADAQEALEIIEELEDENARLREALALAAETARVLRDLQNGQ